jgi:hypothetical protein
VIYRQINPTAPAFPTGNAADSADDDLPQVAADAITDLLELRGLGCPHRS